MLDAHIVFLTVETGSQGSTFPTPKLSPGGQAKYETRAEASSGEAPTTSVKVLPGLRVAG